MQTNLLIDGERVAGEGARRQIFEPEHGRPLAEVADATVAQVDAAVAAARAAGPGWRALTPAARAERLSLVADRLEGAWDEVARLESTNVGKPLRAMREDERAACVDPFRYFGGIARAQPGLAAAEYVAGATSMLRRDPIGVCALIAPWNYPLMMAIWKLAPALAAGNTAVLKPSEQTPLTALWLAEVFADALPAGVVNVVCGDGESIGARLVAHPQVRLVSLTGDIGTGKRVAASAAQSNLKRVHLELGGKAPVIVYDDADVEAAVAAVRAAGFYNAGQDCTAACRVFAHAAIYERLVEALGAAASGLRTGPLDDDRTELGPLVSEVHRARVAGFVERATQVSHARLVTGGAAPDRDGYWFEPTVIADLRPDDELVRREVFGPVVSVTRFGPDDDVLGWANDTEYGLSASVWTKDVSRALHASSVLEYGCVWVNTHLEWPAEMPHGGLKQSGYGKEMSPLGLEDYTVARHVMIRFGGAG